MHKYIIGIIIFIFIILSIKAIENDVNSQTIINSMDDENVFISLNYNSIRSVYR